MQKVPRHIAKDSAASSADPNHKAPNTELADLDLHILHKAEQVGVIRLTV